MPASHVRIGRIEEMMNELAFDMNHAKEMITFYKEAPEKRIYWESQFEYVTKLRSRWIKSFNLDME
ncbi:hypothetical protein NYE70_11345 [Paenibacillus sp. FSL R5-0407]|uniref:hypothetical protein n=1 Tax=Paenibacillus sp. FSL R5-0407 TaxID=2975320 RepID=UPI0030FCF35E